MTPSDSFDQRGQALEDAFFHRVDQKLIEQMKKNASADAGRNALASACPWASDAMLDALTKAEMTAESLVSLTLVPLVRVAWADGRIERNERTALLQAANENDCPESSSGYQMLAAWLDDMPDEQLFELWKQYVHALGQQLGPESQSELKSQVVGQARRIAKAAGGILGLNAISNEENAVLAEIEAAFG